MEKLIKSKYFWSIFIASTISAFVLFLALGKNYKTTTQLMLIPKNEAVTLGVDKILNNAATIVYTDSFLQELASGKDGLQETDLREKIKVQTLSKTSIIVISSYDKYPDRSKKLNDWATKLLIGRLSQYYNIKTELDTRIIERPETEEGRTISYPMAFIASLLIGLIGGIIFHFILSLIPEEEREKVKTEKQESLKPERNFGKTLSSLIDFSHRPKEAKPKKTAPIISDEIPVFRKKEEKNIPKPAEENKKEIVFPSVQSVSSGKKSSAPSNLPIANEEAIKEVNEKLYANKVKEDKPQTQPKQKPTPEELKERLNRLLGGEI